MSEGAREPGSQGAREPRTRWRRDAREVREAGEPRESVGSMAWVDPEVYLLAR